jgi:hypothetical protein
MRTPRIDADPRHSANFHDYNVADSSGPPPRLRELVNDRWPGSQRVSVL